MKFKYFLVIVYVLILACSNKNRDNDAISEATPIPWVEIAKKDSIIAHKKILVVSYSVDNEGKTLANNIAKPFAADVEMIIDKKDRSGCTNYCIAGKDASFGNLTEIEKIKRDPTQYDLVIIGTPIWAWDMTPAIRTYLVDNKDKFKKIAIYTISGNTAPDKIVKGIEEITGAKAISFTGFVKSDFEDKSKYNLLLSNFIDSIEFFLQEK